MVSHAPPFRLTHSIRTADSLFDSLPGSGGVCWLLRTTLAADVVGPRENKLADDDADGRKLNIDLVTCNQIRTHDRMEINSSVCSCRLR